MSMDKSIERRASARESVRPLAWPGDPAGLAATDIDIEAVAFVLSNTCRWGGRTRRFYSVAQHSAVASEAVEALDGLAPEDRRRLALRALIADARIAWLGDAHMTGPSSARAAERVRKDGGRIEAALIEAAGLDASLTAEQADLLRFVARMTDATERRDLRDADFGNGAGAAFPALKRRIRPLDPGRAARLWLARYRALTIPPAGSGGSPAGSAE